MTDAVFWILISMLNWEASGDDDAVVAPVIMELSKRSVEDIYLFDNILAAKLHSLDTRAHAQEIGEYVSALSNSAALHDKSSGFIIWGVDDKTHQLGLSRPPL